MQELIARRRLSTRQLYLLFVLASLFCDSKHCGPLIFRGRSRRENRSPIHDDFLVLLKSEAGEGLFKLLVRGRPELFPGLALFWSRRNCRIWRHDKGEVALQRRKKDGSGLWSWRERARDDTRKVGLRKPLKKMFGGGVCCSPINYRGCRTPRWGGKSSPPFRRSLH
jgi:hypothetical protein